MKVLELRSSRMKNHHWPVSLWVETRLWLKIKFQSKLIKEMDRRLCNKEHKRNDIPKTFYISAYVTKSCWLSSIFGFGKGFCFHLCTTSRKGLMICLCYRNVEIMYDGCYRKTQYNHSSFITLNASSNINRKKKDFKSSVDNPLLQTFKINPKTWPSTII